MLKRIRQGLGATFFVLVTLLLLDVSGALHGWLGWMARVQFLPAVLAVNAAVVAGLVVLTLVFGRIYCSVICPLGVLQDVIARWGHRGKKLPYAYSPAHTWLRYGLLVVFVGLMVAGLTSFAALLAPYSSYGRMVSALLQPLYALANNLLAKLAAHYDSYALYDVDAWLRSLPMLVVAAVSLAVVGTLAWRGGRTYCNALCPVGTVLGVLARYALFKVTINTDKCNGCGLCSRHCKASCIHSKEHQIDYSRCVVCGNCLERCRQGALSYRPAWGRKAKAADAEAQPKDNYKRAFLFGSALAGVTAALAKVKLKTDGGLAVIEQKQVPHRQTHILPPGAISAAHFHQHCTACQLCVDACPNSVLRPSGSLLEGFMQPQLSYERGFCRPECTRCSDVCPTRAILPTTREQKSATQIGHAVWIKKNCVPVAVGDVCGNCARHCPTGAIQMKPIDEANPALRFPVINTERCIGCGACESVCPSAPLTAIYVEGHEVHRTI